MWDFKGQELVVTFVNITFIPLIQQVVLPFNDDTDGGAELEVIKYLSKVLNFRIKLVPSVDGFWGSKTEDGWNGMVGMVARGEADMAFGSISDTQERREVVDFSWPFAEESLGLVSHVPGPVPQWQAVLWPFHIITWLFIILASFASILALCTLWVLHRFLFQLPFQFSGFKIILIFLRPLLNQGIETNAPSRVLRVLLPVWILFCLIIDAAYTGSLVSSMTVPPQKKPLDTFQELIDSSYHQIRISKGSMMETFFHSSEDSQLRSVAKKMDSQETLFYDAAKNTYFQLTKEPYVVYIRNSLVSPVERDMFYSLITGQTFIHISKEVIPLKGLAFILSKDCPYKPDVDKVVRRLTEFGLLKKWMDSRVASAKAETFAGAKTPFRLQVENYIRSLPGVNGADKDQPLTLNHLQGAFFILALGCAASIVAFLFESGHSHLKTFTDMLMP